MRIYGKKPKRGKTYESHTCPTPYGMGDYYGSAVKNAVGRMRDSTNPGFIPVPPKKLKVPPRSVV
jgi:hypothetical protein